MNVKKLRDNATIPTRGSLDAAGYDLYACIVEPITIEPHTTKFIPTGLAMEIPSGYFGGIVARSGLACKHGLAPANKMGIIDADYRGEVMVALHNHSQLPYTVQSNERIAQLLIMPYKTVSFNEVDELSDTDRGDGGFGSTGKQ